MTRFPEVPPEIFARYDIATPRYTSYPTAPVWTERFGAGEHARSLQRTGRDGSEPLSVYVHLPFCRRLCRYCGCHVIVSRQQSDADTYLENLRLEIALVREALGGRRRASRIHLGGGTPTFLDEGQLDRLAEIVRGGFDTIDGAELAVEVDPSVTSPGQLAALARNGWNRISMGVQDFDPGVQQTVNRIQSYDATDALVGAARDLGFQSVNLDLIYGLPGQVEATWQRTLEKIVALRPDRLAVFSFAYVPSVKPHQKLLPTGSMLNGAGKLDLFRAAHDQFVAGGFRWIGMDHFARESDELSRAVAEGRLWRDFQGYTTVRAQETVSLGVSAISFVGGAWVQNLKALSAYRAALAEGVLPVERGHALSEDDWRRRSVITDLMCNLRVDLGPKGESEFEPELASLAGLEADGLVVRDGPRLSVTSLGRVFVRNVAAVFDAYLGEQAGPKAPFSRAV